MAWAKKNPPSGGLGYSGCVEFTDYMLWKALAIVVLAFLAGLFGFIETEGGQEPEAKRDKRPE